MADDRLYAFVKSDADELLQLIGSETTEFSEEWPIRSKGGESSGWLLLTSAIIPARSGTTLGSGTCQIYSRSGATITNTGQTITAYNSQPAAIPSGVIVQAKWWGGVPLIDVVPC